jgi:D-alanyl-D-alanine carboxypeptidase
MRRISFITFVAALAIFASIAVWPKHTSAPSVSKSNSNSTTTTQSVPKFDKTQLSTTYPNSIWVIVNKQHPIVPQSYAPGDLVVANVPLRVPGNESMQLRKIVATATETMFAYAKTQGISLMLSSGYRSYAYQASLYNSYVKASGQATADTQSARPGFSEHQTGLAADIEPLSQKCDVDPCFAQTPEGVWLATNAYKYGFIIRYTAGNEDITGYEAEAWHIRFVGIILAKELYTSGVQTLEQFFIISGGKIYKN